MSAPNVILFTWHDAGDWFGHNGFPELDTPGVDRLAGEGVRFSNCFSACAICSPSRVAMLTGRTCQAAGVMGLTNSVFDNRIDPKLTHLSRRFGARGYHTSLLGVQHECAHEHVPTVIAPDEMVATDPWIDGDRLAAHVGDWVGRRAAEGGPFFGQIGTFDAHLGRFFSDRPDEPGEAYPVARDTSRGLHLPPWLRGSPADEACVAVLQGQLRRGDRVMRTLLESLDRHGLREDTLVVMVVDHGVGLSRAKGTCYDTGTRVSWILSHPGSLPAGRVVDALATHVDLWPTLAGLLDWSIDEEMDGRDFSGHVRSGGGGELNEAVYSHMTDSQRSLRTGRYRFIRNFRPPRIPMGERGDCGERHRGFANPFPEMDWRVAEPSAEYPLVELYDAEADPGNLSNLAGQPEWAGTESELNDRLFEFLFEQRDFILHENPHTPWQRATRLEIEDYCGRSMRESPRVAE